MRIFGGRPTLDESLVELVFNGVADVESATEIVVYASKSDDGKVAIVFKHDPQEVAVYLTAAQMDRIVAMWQRPDRTSGGLPLAYFWKGARNEANARP